MSAFKHARVAAGLTQQAAGEIIGATRRAVQEWEGGRRNCPPAKLALFCMLTQAPQPTQPASDCVTYPFDPQNTVEQPHRL